MLNRKRDGVKGRYFLIHKPDTPKEILDEADVCIQDILDGKARENHSAFPTVVRNHNGTPFFLPDQSFEEVRWGNRPENIPVLERIGITVAEFGGDAFRSAVSDGNRELAQLLLEKGADIDYHKPDMVFPYASTPVTEAARSNDFDMVRWLVENGADIKIADKYGDRPYTIAVQNKNQEMADYLKALEPEEWHNEQEKIRQLKPYKLPVQLTEYLKKGPLRLEFPEQELVKWVELYSYMDIQEMKWQRKKYLSLMVQMDNYSDYMLLWNAKDKKIWYLDIEHEEFHPLASWDEFIANPGTYLNGMIEGKFER